MFKRKNISKKKLWGFADFKITKHHEDKIEIYEEIFSLNLEIGELHDKLEGSLPKEEKLKTFREIKTKKERIQILEKKLKKG